MFQDFFELNYWLVIILASAIDDDLEAGAIEAGGVHGVEIAFEHAESQDAGFSDE